MRRKKLTPRELRRGVAEKKYRITAIPQAPQEWGEYRRGRMEVAIFFAVYWLRGMDINKIRVKLSMAVISKQRANQYITKGCQYLMEHGSLSGV